MKKLNCFSLFRCLLCSETYEYANRKTNNSRMPFQKDENIGVKFLKHLSKVKGWEYHHKIEFEKKEEIKKFIATYVLNNTKGEGLRNKVLYKRFIFLANHPAYKSVIKALLILLELSQNEDEFIQRYQKVTLSSLNDELEFVNLKK